MQNTLKKIILYSIATLCVPCISSTNPDQDNVIEGDVFLVPSGEYRATENDIKEFAELGIPVAPNEIMIPVWATSRDLPGEQVPIVGLRIASNEGVPACSWDIYERWLKLYQQENDANEGGHAQELNQRRRTIESKYKYLHDEDLKKYWRKPGAPKEGRSDNWATRLHPALGNIQFPRHLPYSFFTTNNMVKQDGDTITFRLDGKTIRLTINQENYRYGKRARGYDGFNNILDRLVERAQQS